MHSEQITGAVILVQTNHIRIRIAVIFKSHLHNDYAHAHSHIKEDM